MKILAVFYKEWMLLWRDKVGLLFLFILPMCLVLFISLTSTPDKGGESQKIKMLVLNQDPQGTISSQIVTTLKKIHRFKITEFKGTTNQNGEALKEKVSSGEYQTLITIPPNTSQLILQQIKPDSPPSIAAPIVTVLFDPTLPEQLQSQIGASVQLIVQAIELQLWQQMAHQLSRQKSPLTKTAPGINVQSEIVSTKKGKAEAPNEVQQNVPAWALFGMFFIITPLSGVIVKERRLGVVDRLWLAPVHLFSLISGRMLAFIFINLIQLILMLAVGVFILPLFGLPTLNVTTEPLAILVVGLCAAFAATGFGMLIGSWVRTPEQANVMGPFIIVILASVGGIFIPVYFLPDALKNLANYSPMYWALQSFLDIFVREADIPHLLPNIGKLLAFGLLTTALASLKLKRG